MPTKSKKLQTQSILFLWMKSKFKLILVLLIFRVRPNMKDHLADNGLVPLYLNLA